jgi:hypothetical protein
VHSRGKATGTALGKYSRQGKLHGSESIEEQVRPGMKKPDQVSPDNSFLEMNEISSQPKIPPAFLSEFKPDKSHNIESHFFCQFISKKR